MTDHDIIAQAEEACKVWIPRRDLSVMNLNDFEIILKRSDLMPQLLAEAKAWKVTAIEERANLLMLKKAQEGINLLTKKIEVASRKKDFLELAAKELAEEMRLEGKGDD